MVRIKSRINTSFSPRLKKIPPGFVLVVDTREKTPLFEGLIYPKLLQVRKKLDTGDYSIKGFESQVTVERKALDDLLMCLGKERGRFERELDRLRSFEWAGLMIESSYEKVFHDHLYSNLSPAAAWGSLVAIETRWGVHTTFQPKPGWAECWILDHLIYFYELKRGKHEKKE